jgi:hypothetical protein
MRATECPNCYSTVILTEDGICPACHKNPNAATADRTKTRVTICERQVLPDLCFGCGNQTTSMSIIRRSTTSTILRVLKIIVGVLIFPLKILLFGLRRGLSDDHNTRCYQSLKVKVPICLKCHGCDQPRIIATNFEEGLIAFAVPISVKAEIQRMKSAESGPRE